jgi:hypothetical protein
MFVLNVRKWKPTLVDACETTEDDVTTLTHVPTKWCVFVIVIVFVLEWNLPYITIDLQKTATRRNSVPVRYCESRFYFPNMATWRHLANTSIHCESSHHIYQLMMLKQRITPRFGINFPCFMHRKMHNYCSIRYEDILIRTNSYLWRRQYGKYLQFFWTETSPY